MGKKGICLKLVADCGIAWVKLGSSPSGLRDITGLFLSVGFEVIKVRFVYSDVSSVDKNVHYLIEGHGFESELINCGFYKMCIYLFARWCQKAL